MRLLVGGFRIAVVCGCLFIVTQVAAPASAFSQPIQTGVYLQENDSDATSLQRALAAGTSFARISLSWRAIAPVSVPANWAPSDPADPNYSWATIDGRVQAIVASGLQPILTVYEAPSWAQQGPAPSSEASYLPDPAAFGQFALALARRYSGRFDGLPRVRYFQAWNEPNISLYLIPQLLHGIPAAANDYRLMLNAFADSVHSVRTDNVVISGGLAPFRDITPDVMAQDKDWGPLAFMRAVLCLSASLKPTCHARTRADVWAIHPYTSGNATHKAVLANDVSLGDLGKLQRVMRAAIAVHHIVSSHPLQLWVTEFSWDSKPPDPAAVPITLLRRWVPEAIYQMWRNGVSVAIWFQLHDASLASSYYQSGLYFGNGGVSAVRKPFFEGFRFPFVAYAQGARIRFWGRLPIARAGVVSVQQMEAGAWHTMTTLRSDGSGVFQGFVARLTGGALRARLLATGEASLPFSLTIPPDHIYNPFGLPTLLEPAKKK